MRNFLPPQSAEPEIFLLEQDGAYSGTYGAKNGKPRKGSCHLMSSRDNLMATSLFSVHWNFYNYDQSSPLDYTPDGRDQS